MTLEDLGNVGELIGAIGVIVSLVFVGFQIQRNTKALQTANRETSVTRTIETTRYLAGSEVSELYLSGLSDFHGLPKSEKFQVSMIFLSQVTDWLDQYHKYIEAQMAEDIWLANVHNMKLVLNSPGCKQWLDSSGSKSVSGEFMSYVQKEILE